MSTRIYINDILDGNDVTHRCTHSTFKMLYVFFRFSLIYIYSLRFLVFDESVFLTVPYVFNAVHVAVAALLDVVVVPGILLPEPARLHEGTQDVVLHESGEKHDVDDEHDEHGGGQEPVEAGRHTMPPQPHPIQDPDLSAEATQDEGDEIDVGVEAVQPVVEVKLHHLHKFAGVEEDGVDFCQ